MQHPVFLKRTFAQQEREDGTAKAIAEFKRAYPNWYPCEANAEKLLDFVVSQLGNFEGEDAEYPYPLLLENLQFAYHTILDQGGWFYLQPETPQEEQARLAREEAQRQAVINEENKIRRGTAELVSAMNEQVHVLKEIPINRLRTIVANERPSSPNGRKHQVETLPGGESRPIGMSPKTSSQSVSAKVLQAARRKCALENPTIPRDSVRMNELIHEEIKKGSNA